VIVYRQVGIENLELTESFNLMERIEGSGSRRCQGLSFQRRLFRANADEVGIILDEALQIDALTGQDARHILWRNGEACRQGLDSGRGGILGDNLLKPNC